MCVHTYILIVGYNMGSHHGVIIIDEREKKMTNNDNMIINIYNTNVCSYLQCEQVGYSVGYKKKKQQ